MRTCRATATALGLLGRAAPVSIAAMISDTLLDHVAVAVERHSDAWPRYAGDLAGRWRSGGWGTGFAPAQLEYANGKKIEILAPHRADENDFLRRFLDRNGPGPHHLTFKVGDIDDALADAADAGYQPINVDLSDSTWKEAFLHPRDATGALVQLEMFLDSHAISVNHGRLAGQGPRYNRHNHSRTRH